MTDPLNRFIDQARQKGMDYPTIRLLLRSGGWKDWEIAEAFSTRELAMPVPERTGIGSPSDAFFHLLAFTALYVSVVSLVWLCFTYIEFALPDPVQRVTAYGFENALSGIRVSIAALITAFPLFLALWWFLLREIRKSPERAKSEVRRWLSFATLFVGAVMILGDIITTVYYLVEGDLTLRFLLKVLALMLVTGVVFIYLVLTLHSETALQDVQREARP